MKAEIEHNPEPGVTDNPSAISCTVSGCRRMAAKEIILGNIYLRLCSECSLILKKKL